MHFHLWLEHKKIYHKVVLNVYQYLLNLQLCFKNIYFINKHILYIKLGRFLIIILYKNINLNNQMNNQLIIQQKLVNNSYLFIVMLFLTFIIFLMKKTSIMIINYLLVKKIFQQPVLLLFFKMKYFITQFFPLLNDIIDFKRNNSRVYLILFKKNFLKVFKLNLSIV